MEKCIKCVGIIQLRIKSKWISEFSDVTFPRIKLSQISPWYVCMCIDRVVSSCSAGLQKDECSIRFQERTRGEKPVHHVAEVVLPFSLFHPPLSLSLSFSGCFATSSLMRIGKTGGWEERRYDCADAYNFVKKDFVKPSTRILNVHFVLNMTYFEVSFASNKNKTEIYIQKL